jgi:hypothetical protein
MSRCAINKAAQVTSAGQTRKTTQRATNLNQQGEAM